jgi:hypothetical protein
MDPKNHEGDFMKKHIQNTLLMALTALTFAGAAHAAPGLSRLVEMKGYTLAGQAETACAQFAKNYADSYKNLYCEPTVWIRKVRYSWTEMRTKKELAAILSQSSSGSSSSSGSGSASASVFSRFGSAVAQAFGSYSSSDSYSSYSEIAVFDEKPVVIPMYQDRNDIRYGFVLYGVRGELNLDAPQIYDGRIYNLRFPTFAEALNSCTLMLTHLYGFEHVGRCLPYQDADGQYGFQIEAKPKFK